jgi:PTH1 family peptidyl-tRNA hydrolase
MNLSGESVGQLAQYFDIPASAVLVVHDELDFAPGVVRLKPGGGHGGHNGLRSLMQHLKGEFARVRLGVGKPPHATAGANYVLSRPRGAERDAIEVGVVEAADAVLAVLQDGLERAMGTINQHPPAKSRP